MHWIIFFPLSYIRSFWLEKKFNLSNQNFSHWLKDHIKFNLIKGVFILLIVIVIYTLLRKSQTNWWFISFIVTSLIYISLAGLAPIIIFPLFFKFTPLADETLKERLKSFMQKVNIEFADFFEVDLSKKTKAVNAAIMGFGKTRRIAFSDTLLSQFSPEEIESILGHEAGHLKNRHMLKGIFISVFSLFLFFYLAALLLKFLPTYFGIVNLSDPSSLPLLAFIFSIQGILILPIFNSILRSFEFQADVFSLRHSTSPESLILALNRLAFINLIQKKINPVIEALFHSHPSIQKRIDYLQSTMVKIKNNTEPESLKISGENKNE